MPAARPVNVTEPALPIDLADTFIKEKYLALFVNDDAGARMS